MVLEISPLAYYKLVLHCLKYPHCAVNGVLLGKIGKGVLHALDAIPLFHLSLGTAPLQEVALTQVDCYCAKNGLDIVAYYQANECLDDSLPNAIAKTIVSRIKNHFLSAQLVMVENKEVARLNDQLPLAVYSGSNWDSVGQIQFVGGPESLQKINALLRNNHQHSLVDFDSHLEDVILDWLNPAINEVFKNVELMDPPTET